jgi:hypothetical protein
MTHEKYAVRKNYLEGMLMNVEADLERVEKQCDYRYFRLKLWLDNSKARIARRRKRIEAQLVKLQNTKLTSRRVH